MMTFIIIHRILKVAVATKPNYENTTFVSQ